MRCAIVLGTRPEIIKMAPVIQACIAQEVPFYILHTGQHYDRNMDGAFFEDLALPAPNYNLHVGSGPHGQQTGRMMAQIEEVFAADRPAIVMVQGDTNTVLAGGLVAAKLHVPVGHVEAGLRSYDRRMPEEINRVVVDHVGTHLFAPTQRARTILQAEGVAPETIFVTGNTIADVVLDLIARGRLDESRLAPLGVRAGEYILITAHRPENVDDPQRLAMLIGALADVAGRHGLAGLYPCHPRTRARLEAFGIALPASIRMIEPVGLFDFLTLERFARIILTDSGGVQEEACICRVPCVTLRQSTERPETVEVGANVLAGIRPESVAQAADTMLARPSDWDNPFGDGTAGQQIARLAAPLTE